MTTLDQDSISRLVDVDGSAVYVSIGAPSAGRPPVVLINGMGARFEMWRSFGSAFTGRQLIMFDLPGISGRAAPGFPLFMAGLAEWVTKLLDTIGVEKADLLGYSWGGVLAQEIARVAPSRVRGLVLASTNFGFGGVPLPPLTVSQLSSASGLGSDHPWELLIATAGGVGRNPVTLLSTLNPASSSINGYLRQLCAVTGWTSLPWLQQLRLPTLVLAGDDDPFIPTMTTRALAEAIPGARLALIPGGGHLLPANRPVEMAGMVRQFLDDIDT